MRTVLGVPLIRVLVLCTLVNGCVSRSDDQRSSEATNRHGTLALGHDFPDVILPAPNGEEHRILDALGPSGALIFIVDEKDCLTCADFPTEVRIARHHFPKVRPFFIAVGDNAEWYRGFFRAQRLENAVYYDPSRSVLRQLGVSNATPLILYVNSDGRILFADPRGGPDASRYPITRVLQELTRGLTDTLQSDRAR